MSAAFDLATTYVKLDADDRGRAVPVDACFWREIDSRPEYAHGRLVMTFTFDRDWPTWEVHPAGEEIVTVLAGEMHFVLHGADGDETFLLRAGETCIVPRNTWHTAKIAGSCTALFVTPCAGTRNAVAPAAG
jgi:mannose-6-phosphate isomerase-like protein (cupin superfamily)